MSSNPSSPNRLPLLLLLLAAVGVPTAAGLAFADKVTQDPVRAFVLALIYEIAVIVFGFVAKIWQKLESRWVDRVANAVDSWALSLFSNFHKKYLQFLVYRHRDFDVKGLSTQGTYTLELEQVFVELSIAPQPAHQISTDPLRVAPQALREGHHTIWDHLRACKDAQTGRLYHLAIIGAPGSGKTTLVKHVALTLASPNGARAPHARPLHHAIPILLFLRDHANAIKTNADYTLAQAVRESLAKWELVPPTGWFEARLAKGQCLVLLDGLDEVADAQSRQLVVDWVERQMVAHAQNIFVVTSRPHGYRSNPLNGVTVTW